MTKPRFIGHEAQYICQDSKLLASVAYFAQLVETSLWAFWVGQHAPYTRFLSRPDQPGRKRMYQIREAKGLLSLYVYCGFKFVQYYCRFTKRALQLFWTRRSE